MAPNVEEIEMLVRTRPYRPAVALRTADRSFDRAFDQLTSSFFSTVKRSPVVDASWRDGDLVLAVDLPGVPVEHVAVAVADRTLTLSASIDDATWERSIRLGAALDADQVSARHVDGRLTVTVAAAAQPAARTIEISTAAPVAIDAGETAESAESGPIAETGPQPENGTGDNA